MEKLFESIFLQSDGTTKITVLTFIISLLVSLIMGIVISLFAYYKGRSSKHFYIANSILPMAVSMVIMLVNGNIGIGVAIAGAFSLVRFRSAQGNAKEIAVIFISMAMGLAFGVGYITYGIIFGLVSGLSLILFTKIKVFNKKESSEKLLKITIPESIDYIKAFDDIFEKYTSSYNLVKSKSTNMGSLFVLSYEISLKDNNDEKKFVDEIRCRNGNLEIQISRIGNSNDEL
jgi:uncharacterized membrane protein YhiD involved in acid resistance